MNNLIEVRKDIPSGTILIRNPDRRNALSTFGLIQLRQALEDLHQEKGVRAVIITGDQNIFCSGTDMKQLCDELDPEGVNDIQQDVELLAELLMVMLRFPKPIIAALNGPAAGSGLAVALASDFIIGAESASVSSPEVLRGLVAGMTLGLLEFRAGATVAARMGLTGQTLSAAEAQRLGFIQEVVADDLVWARSQQLATELANGSPPSQQMTKKLLNETIADQLEKTLTLGVAMTATARTTSHATEGIQAFLEKRKPDWK